MEMIQREQVKDAIRDWILGMDGTEQLPNEIAALNFGLYEPYGIELIGSKKYFEEDDDWACEEDFVPKQRNCPDIKIPESFHWETVLNAIVEILKELVAELPNVNLLHVEHITTGFSDGDLIVVK